MDREKRELRRGARTERKRLLTDGAPSEQPDGHDWAYDESVWATCPECGVEVAVVTDRSEFGGARCADCDERMEVDFR